MSLKKHFRAAIEEGRARTGKIQFLLNDFVIEEQLCHLRCSYCLTEDFNLLMAVPDAQQRLTTDARESWHAVLDRFHETIDCPVLRISGGEFLWLKGSTEFLEECTERYETVQIITNGVLLADKLDRLAARPNLSLNISLDGHTLEANRHRFHAKQERLLPQVLSNLARAVELGMKVDIQTVLTDANVDAQVAFCEFLNERHPGSVTLYFIPARGTAVQRFHYEPGPYLDAVVDRYDELASVLPPKAYVAHIAAHVREGRRVKPCFVTATMGQLFGSGAMSACPHAWVETMTNVVEAPAELQDLIGVHSHYDLFLQKRPRFPFCKTCATPSDLVNLYFLNEISDDEIGSCSLYSGPRTRARLHELKALYGPILTPLDAVSRA